MMHNDIALCPDTLAEPLRERFRDAMSRVPAAVHILTSDGAAGRCGLTATAVLSVSDEPPTVLISLNRTSVSAQRLLANEVFCVNTLGAEDAFLADVFAGRTALQRDDRFSAGEWGELVTRSPVLATARAAFDCRLIATTHAATHQLLVGEVLAMHGSTGGEDSLIYLNRGFRHV
ncbi:flavin reductase [Paraburkholderia bryophila]|uniref:flavin reductase n=1 Tax=Paraburkholderia bryophila TaxID=420952 RepID=UPI00234BEB37|nr:flavin reductase [Paraburkholderia bryophila]WCM22541.1 flavin reductase [Paraburkholderia bryophila]